MLAMLDSLGAGVQPALWDEGLCVLPQALVPVQAPKASDQALPCLELVACTARDLCAGL